MKLWVSYKIHNIQSNFSYNSLLFLETAYTSEMNEMKDHYRNKWIFPIPQKIQLWNASKWNLSKETKVTFATGKLSFNALMKMDEDRLTYYSLRE